MRITLPLFYTDYTRQMGSIEAAYIGLARYIARHWSDLQLVPALVRRHSVPGHLPAAAALDLRPGDRAGARFARTGASLRHRDALRAGSGDALSGWRGGCRGNRGAAFAAGLGYSPDLADVPAGEGGALRCRRLFAARRLHTLVVYGEGPHLTSLCLLPLAIGMLHVALTRTPARGTTSARRSRLPRVPLSNWLGAVALAFGVASTCCSASTRRWRAVARRRRCSAPRPTRSRCPGCARRPSR